MGHGAAGVGARRRCRLAHRCHLLRQQLALSVPALPEQTRGRAAARRPSTAHRHPPVRRAPRRLSPHLSPDLTAPWRPGPPPRRREGRCCATGPRQVSPQSGREPVAAGRCCAPDRAAPRSLPGSLAATRGVCGAGQWCAAGLAALLAAGKARPAARPGGPHGGRPAGLCGDRRGCRRGQTPPSARRGARWLGW